MRKLPKRGIDNEAVLYRTINNILSIAVGHPYRTKGITTILEKEIYSNRTSYKDKKTNYELYIDELISMLFNLYERTKDITNNNIEWEEIRDINPHQEDIKDITLFKFILEIRKAYDKYNKYKRTLYNKKFFEYDMPYTIEESSKNDISNNKHNDIKNYVSNYNKNDTKTNIEIENMLKELYK